MTVSVSAHVSQESRDKLQLYKEVHGFKNLSDTVDDIVKKMPTPVEKKKTPEDDPDQTALPGCES
jgi:hypothetical protein